ncbi:extensin-like domain-containing protein [Sphingosinicella terrae]|uniref:extensin-like domain-containing protein n=1 Tax=Sphingosinicella terrae TaxID=2172047 RepID=UPI000E0CEE98|nr:extensin family protein [Sphingosinicella terrae]
MRRLRRTIVTLILLGLLGLGALLLYGHARSHPEDMPWTALDLTRPVGMFTGRKIADLADEGPRCQALLDQAGVRFTALPARGGGEQCGYDHAVRLRTDGALGIRYSPSGLGTSCSVAAALALWEWHVVQPAAQRHFGSEVERIEHFGSYSCRRLYGRDSGAWSEHATANAVDIAGFVLADGTRISVVRDWDDEAAAGRFLREVRDGACDLFATVLSPDYNEAHRDHFHLDQAQRGTMGWRACR